MISDENEAISFIDSVRSDRRIAELLRIFDSGETGEIQRIIQYADGSARSMLTTNEELQLDLILEHWRKPTSTNLAANESLADLARAAHKWDFRLGKERDMIPSSTEILPYDVTQLVNQVCGEWRMLGDTGISGEFDIICAIGGLVRANLARPATAAALLEGGGVRAKHVVGLAGVRNTGPAERALAIEMGVPPDSEQDALRFGLEQAFKLDPSGWEVWQDNESIWRNASGIVPVTFGAAPLRSNGRRATTGEALTWLQEKLLLTQRSSILQITTSIYWIANQIALRTSTPRPMTVRTIGHSGMLHTGPEQVFRSQHYLQELKSVLDSLPGLERWAHHNEGS